MKYRPKVGRKVDIEDDSFGVKSKNYLREQTRSVIAIGVFAASFLALSVAAFYGFLNGEFDGLKNTFQAVGPIIGVIIGWYFTKGSPPGGERDN